MLRRMPGVADVRVLGAPDAARGEQIVACVVPSERWDDGARGAAVLRRRLAPHKIPRTIVLLDASR